MKFKEKRFWVVFVKVINLVGGRPGNTMNREQTSTQVFGGDSTDGCAIVCHFVHGGHMGVEEYVAVVIDEANMGHHTEGAVRTSAYHLAV